MPAVCATMDEAILSPSAHMAWLGGPEGQSSQITNGSGLQTNQYTHNHMMDSKDNGWTVRKKKRKKVIKIRQNKTIML